MMSMPDAVSMAMRDLKGYLTDDQVNSILNETTSLRDRALIQIGYRCGRRVSEVLLMKCGDILFDENKIIFNILKRRTPLREIKPVDTDTMLLLKKYINLLRTKGLKSRRKGDLLFPVSRQYVHKLIRKLGKKAGIEFVGSKRLHYHHLRHSFAVHQVRTNVKTAEDLRRLQMYMSHMNIGTTMHYLQFSPDELRGLVSGWDR